MEGDPVPILLTLKRYLPTRKESVHGTKYFSGFLKRDLIERMLVFSFQLCQQRNSHIIFLHFSGGPNTGTLNH